MGWQTVMNWDFTFILSSLIQPFKNKTSRTLCFTVLCPFMPRKDKAQIAAVVALLPSPSNSPLIWQSDLKGPVLGRM